MSGGAMEYLYSRMEYYTDTIPEGEFRDFYEAFTNLLRDYEWYLSGDHGEETWKDILKDFNDDWGMEF